MTYQRALILLGASPVRCQRRHEGGDGREKPERPAGAKWRARRYVAERMTNRSLGLGTPGAVKRREEPAKLPRIATVQLIEEVGQTDDGAGAVDVNKSSMYNCIYCNEFKDALQYLFSKFL